MEAEPVQTAGPSTPSQLFVRINSGQLGLDDLEIVVRKECTRDPDAYLVLSYLLPLQLKSPHLDGIVLPKVDTADQVRRVDRCIDEHGLDENKDSLKIIASVESALSLLNLRDVGLRGSVTERLQDFISDCFAVKTDCHVIKTAALSTLRCRRLLRLVVDHPHALARRDALREIVGRSSCKGFWTQRDRSREDKLQRAGSARGTQGGS